MCIGIFQRYIIVSPRAYAPWKFLSYKLLTYRLGLRLAGYHSDVSYCELETELLTVKKI